jgi:hypothetical protein
MNGSCEKVCIPWAASLARSSLGCHAESRHFPQPEDLRSRVRSGGFFAYFRDWLLKGSLNNLRNYGGEGRRLGGFGWGAARRQSGGSVLQA